MYLTFYYNSVVSARRSAGGRLLDRSFVFLQDCCVVLFSFRLLLFGMLEEVLLNYSFESQNVHALPLEIKTHTKTHTERERGSLCEKKCETITLSYIVSGVIYTIAIGKFVIQFCSFKRYANCAHDS